MESLIENYSDYTTFNGQGGRWFSGNNTYRESIENKIFLPAAGWLWSTDGGPTYRDEKPELSMGNYWVSSTTTQYGDHLSFTPSFTRIYSDYRAYGMSVRCVK